MIPLLSLLLAVVVEEVKASTRAVVVAGDAVMVVVLGADDVVALVLESPPSRPKPKRPPSGAAETIQRRGRRLNKCIVKAFQTRLVTKVLKCHHGFIFMREGATAVYLGDMRLAGWRCHRLVKDLSANRGLYLADTPAKVCPFTKY